MLAQTPPRGWNSWNTFTSDISEELIMETADAMAAKLLEAGYEYLVIDDCWSELERENGKLVADRKKFPHGMKYVADYVHSKGLKFGMYSCCGPRTCAGYPGSFGHEFEDARYFAEVGVDLLKYDNCYHPSMQSRLSYNRMSLALRATGREILFSACNWGNDEVWTWARAAGAHMYRSTGDITDTFDSVVSIASSQRDKLAYSAPGCFNDVDMLVTGLRGTGNIGHGKGCTDAQYRYHFAMWCMYSAPLMLGCDVRNLTEENYSLITNKTLLRINGDTEARPPIFVRDNRGQQENVIMFKHLSSGFAVAMFNGFSTERSAMLPFYEIGLDPMCGYGMRLCDAFTGEEFTCVDYADFKVPAGDCRVFTGELIKL